MNPITSNRESRFRFLLFILLGLGSVCSPSAVWDLQSDWSDTANPNGVWAYREGNNALPQISAWQPASFATPQPAWSPTAEGNPFLPSWFKSTGPLNPPLDWQTGDVVVHTTDGFNGAGRGPANITWTSPIAGAISVSGSVWMPRDIGRGNHWTLSRNGVVLSEGDVSSGDAYSRTNPFHFATGSGGASALANLTVAVGDVIRLQLDRTSSAGDFVGVNLTVTEGSSSGATATLFATSQSGGVYRFQIGPSGVPVMLPTITNASFSLPTALAVSTGNELFVVNNVAVAGGQGTVSRFLDPAGTPVFNGSITGGFSAPHGAAFRGGELLVVDSYNNRVRRYTFDVGGTPTEIVSLTSGLHGAAPRWVTVGPNGNEVFVSQCQCDGANEVHRILINGDTITDNGAINAGLSNPHGLVFSSAGELFVANSDANSISRFTFSNGVAVANGTITGNGLAVPIGLAFSPWGELFAANNGFAPGGSKAISRWNFAPNGAAVANGTISVPSAVADVAFVNFVVGGGGPVFVPFCTNLTVLLAAESTNCVVSTNAVTNATTVVSGLIDWLKADGDALDATGNNHAVSFAVGYESGLYNQAFSFSPQPFTGNANGRRVDLGALVQLYGATGFTFSAWVKLPQPVTDWVFPFTFPAIFPNANAPLPGQDKAYNQFGLNIGASNNLAPNFIIGFSNGVIRSAGTGVPIPLNTWVHLAVTWRNSDGQLRMFQNGTGGLASFGGAGSTLPVATQRNLNGTALSASLGVWDFVGGTGGPDTVIERYTGEALAMDDVRIYARALSPAEIQHIVASEPPEIIESGETNCTVIPAQTTNLTFCAASAGKLKILDAPPGQVELRWSSLTNAYYLLESSAGLVPVEWTNAWGAGLGNGTNVSVLAPKTPQAQRFYRLLSTER